MSQQVNKMLNVFEKQRSLYNEKNFLFYSGNVIAYILLNLFSHIKQERELTVNFKRFGVEQRKID